MTTLLIFLKALLIAAAIVYVTFGFVRLASTARVEALEVTAEHVLCGDTLRAPASAAREQAVSQRIGPNISPCPRP